MLLSGFEVAKERRAVATLISEHGGTVLETITPIEV